MNEPAAFRQLIQILNRVRQVRDSLPPMAWEFVPAPVRIPLEEAFAFCEQYDRARPTPESEVPKY